MNLVFENDHVHLTEEDIRLECYSVYRTITELHKVYEKDEIELEDLTDEVMEELRYHTNDFEKDGYYEDLEISWEDLEDLIEKYSLETINNNGVKND
tara:strand:+ start:215 stop:505 length:291 start_codon:yes stop_codon:yes gene_type:complete